MATRWAWSGVGACGHGGTFSFLLSCGQKCVVSNLVMSMLENSWWANPSGRWRYVFALVSVALATVLGWVLDRFWQSTPYVSLFLCAIMFSAWSGGFRAGFLATGLSALAFAYFFLQPTHSLLVDLNELPRLFLFTGAALVIALFSGSQRSAAESLRQARDELAEKVKELSRLNKALQAEMNERKHAEEALVKAQSELAHMTRLTTIGELTASIAHEVNQPLAAIMNNGNACLTLLPNGDPHVEDLRAALTEIVDDAERAGAVINRVRQLAKKAPFEKTRLRLMDVVTEVLTLARFESLARGVAIRTELAADLPLVAGDRVQLQQVLLNLVVNGMDAMAKIEQNRRVLIIASRPKEEDGNLAVLIAVRDCGVGFKAGESSRLFEPFYTTKSNGLGMGLAISRSIIEAHGGRLWAESNNGPGATFSFSLPASLTIQ